MAEAIDCLMVMRASSFRIEFAKSLKLAICFESFVRPVFSEPNDVSATSPAWRSLLGDSTLMLDFSDFSDFSDRSSSESSSAMLCETLATAAAPAADAMAMKP